MMRSRHLVMAAAIVSGILFACSPAPGSQTATSPVAQTPTYKPLTFKTVEQGKLTVALVDGFLPCCALSGGKLIGYEGYLMNRFAGLYGLEVKPFPTTFSSMLLAVREG